MDKIKELAKWAAMLLCIFFVGRYFWQDMQDRSDNESSNDKQARIKAEKQKVDIKRRAEKSREPITFKVKSPSESTRKAEIFFRKECKSWIENHQVDIESIELEIEDLIEEHYLRESYGWVKAARVEVVVKRDGLAKTFPESAYIEGFHFNYWIGTGRYSGITGGGSKPEGRTACNLTARHKDFPDNDTMYREVPSAKEIF